MGKITYGSKYEMQVDDYTLAHVKVVVLSKLRLGQGFPFNWSSKNGGGRSTVWIDPAIPLEFAFDTDLRPEPNRQWVDALMNSANSSEGLRIVPEP